MTRVLAIDFGEKRIGLATGDTSGGIATPRRTILRSSDDAAAAEIARFCRDELVEELLVGIPRSPADGSESAIAPRIRSFAEKLGLALALPVGYHEETLTSDEAARRIRGRRSRAGVDAEAAAVLLEDWLSHRGRKTG